MTSSLKKNYNKTKGEGYFTKQQHECMCLKKKKKG